MKDWTKLTAKERIDMIIAARIEQTGKIPSQINISKKLLAELWVERELENYHINMDGRNACYHYRHITLITNEPPQQPH